MRNTITSRNNWQFDYLSNQFDFTKENLINLYIRKTLIKTQKIFSYHGLPDTIPQDDLELMLQTRGFVAVTNTDLPSLYAFTGGLGGEPTPYYRPTFCVVANPSKEINSYSKTLYIDKDCIIIRNDPLYMGLLPIIQQASYLLAEVDISFKFACVNIRVPALVKAKDDRTAESAMEFFRQVERGDSLGVVIDDDLIDGISVYDYANSDTSITHLIELKQYIMGTFYQELGIQSNFNMKREAINEAEAALSESVLYPTIDDMLLERQNAVAKINAKYGTDISVELSSVWKQLRDTAKQKFEMNEAEKQADLSKAEEPKKQTDLKEEQHDE